MKKNHTRTIGLYIQYDGTSYSGWQRQPKQISVQEVLENALTKIANEKATVFASGRTDAGVHARKQLISLSLEQSQTPIHAFVEGTNTLLPPDIRVLSAKEEDVSFHAIKNTSSKIYRYFFLYNPIENVFLHKHVWQTRFPFNISLMKDSLHTLEGKHDFSCFRTHGIATKTAVRTIHNISINQTHEQIYYLELEGDGFLRHMVRSIMGTLMDIGAGKIPAHHLQKILKSKDRTKAGQTAPACGLFLWDVKVK